MTLQQAAWHKNAGAERAEYEASHPYPFASILGNAQNKSIRPSRFPGRQLLVVAIVITVFILF